VNVADFLTKMYIAFKDFVARLSAAWNALITAYHILHNFLSTFAFFERQLVTKAAIPRMAILRAGMLTTPRLVTREITFWERSTDIRRVKSCLPAIAVDSPFPD